ncbi:MAG: hypothetical protein A2700_03120 [Candidatus Blackburnbacteria bacterium RIFCSPHIGHO2_01_FULL_44_64]|uniref:Regulatory protein RecX n=1 Tax=Candidatus Blackburnbacteria bacterium RIFCSPHIGHO2_02_FULL_44_20 TaxID=1797516 RepID=A0A1G1VAE4_9BACT|nr:MAG: hypothetical protein A2700_03120 [Candidatus Blackburnbacteria bacterium RIFCSPHIGHO2_01_FULL_44_64]OGY11746.1 MAG: hypothetical protein A3E16_03005 [Candidatus Blackburnbacteria bacterium RIFCSPHIGHO2_12_FULL_44_25]OGY12356.1 MAG: hypothetical protein A3D26_01885 [Candidatus Blackburnbacteria bacterium RIFCSPHIGHO2_02_FULL_44_20]OGY15999.1 MAG: hypothetical protein A3H88_00530 [Candidatus Blackburnbacteria bacterium RIFCSPLOWO2_02_FULL_44_9]
MPQITRLVQQRNKNRVNVYLDGKFAFSVTLESALENNLKLEKILSQEEMEKLRGKDFDDKIFSRLTSFAVRRPHSKKEIEIWLHRKGIQNEEKEKFINRLIEIGLINDEEFAKWWADQRVTFRAKPAKMIKMELRAKGVEDEIITRTLEEQEGPTDEERAQRVLTKKYGKIPKAQDMKEKKRIYDFLLRRGFSYETIKKVLAQNL